MQLERFSEAAAAFKKALELDPSNDRIAQDLRQAEEKAAGNAPAAAAAPSGIPGTQKGHFFVTVYKWSCDCVSVFVVNCQFACWFAHWFV